MSICSPAGAGWVPLSHSPALEPLPSTSGSISHCRADSPPSVLSQSSVQGQILARGNSAFPLLMLFIHILGLCPRLRQGGTAANTRQNSPNGPMPELAPAPSAFPRQRCSCPFTTCVTLSCSRSSLSLWYWGARAGHSTECSLPGLSRGAGSPP